MGGFIDELVAKVQCDHPGEPDFHHAVRDLLESVAPVVEGRPEYRTNGLLERMVEPERVILFRVPWEDDRGAVHVQRGFRVAWNSALGPYKGGLRFHPSVRLGLLKSLAFEQTFKNALTKLGMGGAKGGADFNPRIRSDGEVMRFCQAFMSELYRHIGDARDVPAGDIGVGAREVGYLFGQYRKLSNRFDGALTGKGRSWGGSLLRPEATGYGLVYFAWQMLATRGESLEGKVVAMSGYGSVGFHALTKLAALGARVVTLADEEGFIYDPDGIRGEKKLGFVHDLWFGRRGAVREYADCFHVRYEPGRPWNVPCEVALPTATQNEIDAKDALELVRQGCRFVAEGSNLSSTHEAVAIFREHGVLYAPGKAANAGGVSVSGLEMAQNAGRLAWTRDEVDARLRQIMSDIHDLCLETARAHGAPGDYVHGANIASFLRVADAMRAQGVV